MHGVENLKKDKLGNVRRQHFWRVRCYFHATLNVSFILESFKCSLNRSTFLFLSCWLICLDRQLLVGFSRSGNSLVKVARSCFLNFSRWRPIWHSLYFICKQGRKAFPLLISNRRDIQFLVTIPPKKLDIYLVIVFSDSFRTSQRTLAPFKDQSH
jgi:hypothetical protein